MLVNDRIRSARLCLVPLAVADAGEMVRVLSGEALYAFTGGAPPTLAELRARYARQAAGRSPDGSQEWRNWIVRRRRPAGRPGAHRPVRGRRAGLAPRSANSETAVTGRVPLSTLRYGRVRASHPVAASAPAAAPASAVAA
jgi:hypothetical protein